MVQQHIYCFKIKKNKKTIRNDEETDLNESIAPGLRNLDLKKKKLKKISFSSFIFSTNESPSNERKNVRK